MKSRVLFGVVLAAIVGVACASRPDQVVLQATVIYGGAVKAAVAYESLPRCTMATPAGALCSREDIVAMLRQADNVAKAAIDASQKTVLTPGIDASSAQFAATAAINAAQAFQAIVASQK